MWLGLQQRQCHRLAVRAVDRQHDRLGRAGSTETPSLPASQQERRRLPVCNSVDFWFRAKDSIVGYLPPQSVSAPWDGFISLHPDYYGPKKYLAGGCGYYRGFRQPGRGSGACQRRAAARDRGPGGRVQEAPAFSTLSPPWRRRWARRIRLARRVTNAASRAP